jgi:TetR/AcrR family transcriptional repressor of nem operon
MILSGMADDGAGSVKVQNAGELTPKGRATRDRIVAAAADLMFEQGVAGTSLQDVQQAARVSGSQMYHYFGDKASLAHAVIAWQGETLLGRRATSGRWRPRSTP